MRNKGESGASILELVIALPILIALIFFTLTYTIAQNSNFSLHSAMGNAVQIAVTRGKKHRLGLEDGLIEPLESWYAGSPSGFGALNNGELEGLFNKGVPVGNLDGTMKNLVFKSFTNGGSPAFPDDVPLFYYYTLFYIYQAMEQSVGAGLKYPCDPDTDGCLLCTFHHPGLVPENTEYDFGMDGALTEHAVRIRCTYKAFTPLWGVAFALLSQGGGSDAGPLISAVIHYDERPPV